MSKLTSIQEALEIRANTVASKESERQQRYAYTLLSKIGFTDLEKCASSADERRLVGLLTKHSDLRTLRELLSKAVRRAAHAEGYASELDRQVKEVLSLRDRLDEVLDNE